MKMVKLDKEMNIGVIFNGKMNVCSITKYTTCDDVIEMVMYQSLNADRAHEYALFETAHGVEKMLTGRSSVLKVVRSWGTAKGDVSLMIRKMDGVIKKKIKISKAKKKLEKIRSLLNGHKNENKPMNNTMKNNLNDDQRSEKKVYEKCLKIQNDESTVPRESGKLALMKRYLSDLAKLTYSSPQDQAMDVSYSDSLIEEGDNDDESGSDLDTAFVGEFDETVIGTSDELNDCIIFDQDTSDAESAFSESDCSENELEKNIFEDDLINTDEVRKLFDQCRYKHNASYDKAIESFMESMVCREYSDDADEGLSSMGSGN